MSAGGQVARDLVAAVEPTGLARDARTRTDAQKELQRKLAELDVASINESVVSLRNTIEDLRAKLAELDVEGWDDVRRSLARTIEDAMKEVDQADLSNLSAVVAELAETMQRQVEAFDVAALNATLARLDESVASTQSEATRFAGEARELLRAVPAEQARDALVELELAVDRIGTVATGLPGTIARVNEAAESARMAMQVATGVLLLLGLGTLFWAAGTGRRAFARRAVGEASK